MSITLYIKESNKKGRGVFSKQNIIKGAVIETCLLIVMPDVDYDFSSFTIVNDYCFRFDKGENQIAIAMGFGSLYNHKCPANADHKIDTETKTMQIIALEDIPAHQEIYINYHGAFNDNTLEWFESRKILYIESA
jgi:uncharacterized protein